MFQGFDDALGFLQVPAPAVGAVCADEVSRSLCRSVAQTPADFLCHFPGEARDVLRILEYRNADPRRMRGDPGKGLEHLIIVEYELGGLRQVSGQGYGRDRMNVQYRVDLRVQLVNHRM